MYIYNIYTFYIIYIIYIHTYILYIYIIIHRYIVYIYIYIFILAVPLVTGMIDAFCELIASLNFPWLVCLFLGFSFPLFLPWKPNKTKGKQRTPKENHRIQPAPNQRKTKEIKRNWRKPKEPEGNESKSKDTLWRMHVPVMLIKTKEFLWYT